MNNVGTVIITTKDNGHDMHGYQKLYEHRSHPRVAAQRYLYLHDTCVVRPMFFSTTNQIKVKKYEIKTCSPPYSNIILMGCGVVESYQNRFSGNWTKQDMFRYENGTILEYEHVLPFGKRKYLGDYDIYNTGYPRSAFLYEDFDVVKYILWGRNGDMTSDVKPN